MTEIPRCTLVILSSGEGGDDGLKQAVRDPGLAALVAEGRKVLSSMVIQSGDGGPDKLGILFTPPQASKEHGTVLAIESLRLEVRWAALAVVIAMAVLWIALCVVVALHVPR